MTKPQKISAIINPAKMYCATSFATGTNVFCMILDIIKGLNNLILYLKSLANKKYMMLINGNNINKINKQIFNSIML